jgi:membrane fusion protein (multidrug efflux system)
MIRLAVLKITVLALATMPASGAHPSELPGVVEPIHQITVQPLIEGRIASIEVSESQRVSTDQLLICLDDRLAQAEVSMAEKAAAQTGKLQFAEAELQRSEITLNRLLRVSDHHAIAARDLEDARFAVAKAKGNLKIAQDELDALEMDVQRARLNLLEYSVRAPFPGVVSKIRVSAGQTVNRQTVLMTLVDTSRLRVELSVPLDQYQRMEIGQNYRLPTESPIDNGVMAVLVAVDPTVNAGTNTFRCVFEIDNADGALPAGFLAYPPDLAHTPKSH